MLNAFIYGALFRIGTSNIIIENSESIQYNIINEYNSQVDDYNTNMLPTSIWSIAYSDHLVNSFMKQILIIWWISFNIINKHMTSETG